MIRALQKQMQSVVAMEFFLAAAETPLETVLDHLRKSDIILLVIGFYAGSLLPDGSGRSYTRVEYEQAKQDKKPIFTFLKVNRRKRWHNNETEQEKIDALNQFKQDLVGTWATFRRPTVSHSR